MKSEVNNYGNAKVKKTLNVTAEGFSGTYDGNSHGINVTADDGAVVTYSTKEDGTYSATNPTYTNAGNYTVYYKVTKSGYTTVKGYKVIEIKRIELLNPITLSANSVLLPQNSTAKIEVKSNVSGGKLSVRTTNSNIATATISGNTITISTKSVTGNVNLIVESEEVGNYSSGMASCIVKVVSSGDVSF